MERAGKVGGEGTGGSLGAEPLDTLQGTRVECTREVSYMRYISRNN